MTSSSQHDTPETELPLNSFDSFLVETSASPLLASFFIAKSEYRKIFVSESHLASLFAQEPELTADGVISMASLELLTLDPSDLYFIKTDSPDDLIDISKRTCAQVVAVTTHALSDDFLCDFHLSWNELESFLKQIKSLWPKFIEKKPKTLGSTKLTPALFLDRDGVIVKHIDHLHKSSEVSLQDGIVDLIKKARQKGYLVIVVTNQSGLGRQYFLYEDYRAVTDKMLGLLAEQGAYVDDIYFSPYFSNSKLALGLRQKSLRKPRPGMLLKSAQDHTVDLAQSLLVGDRATDIIAASLANLRGAYLLDSGHTQKELFQWQQWTSKYGHPKTAFFFQQCHHLSDIQV